MASRRWSKGKEYKDAPGRADDYTDDDYEDDYNEDNEEDDVNLTLPQQRQLIIAGQERWLNRKTRITKDVSIS